MLHVKRKQWKIRKGYGILPHNKRKGCCPMGTLQYAILGMLNRDSMTGYDLTREFQTSLFDFWTAKHSQVYPELKSLLEKGYVEYETEISGTALEK